jgi:hypothetical protein
VDVWTYFQQREKECRELSLEPIGDFNDMIAAEAGSAGRRGRIFGAFALTEDAYIQVSEVVVVEDDHMHREEYGYFLIIDNNEVWGEERDLSHDPAVHRHIGPDHAREPSEPIAFRAAVERAWASVTEHYERRM